MIKRTLNNKAGNVKYYLGNAFSQLGKNWMIQLWEINPNLSKTYYNKSKKCNCYLGKTLR